MDQRREFFSFYSVCFFLIATGCFYVTQTSAQTAAEYAAVKAKFIDGTTTGLLLISGHSYFYRSSSNGLLIFFFFFILDIYQYKLFVPVNYTSAVPARLVVVLHGIAVSIYSTNCKFFSFVVERIASLYSPFYLISLITKPMLTTSSHTSSFLS